MRTSIDNGNGAKCDKCNRLVLPNERIRISARTLSPDTTKAASGYEITIGKLDLCPKCFKDLQTNFQTFKPPRIT